MTSGISYRTLSIHLDEPISKSIPKSIADPTAAIRQIDAHIIDHDQVFSRYSTHPTLGLEHAAVERKSKEGKNVITPPPTQYWKKALNYVFGGFNFLMWIAFIVTLVCTLEYYMTVELHPSFV